MVEYDENLCEERHQNIEKTLDDHEKRINTLEKDGATLTAEIKHLCSQMSNLIGTIKWSLGIFVTVALFVIGILIKKG